MIDQCDWAYIQMNGEFRRLRSLNPSGLLGEWIEDAALLNPPPHLYNLHGEKRLDVGTRAKQR